MKVFENDDVVDYMQKHQLVSLYIKAKEKIERDDFRSVQLRKRQPHSNNIWYFRIDRKYRALATREKGNLYVFKISDHQ